MLVILKSDGDRVLVNTDHVVSVTEDRRGITDGGGAPVVLVKVADEPPFSVDATFEETCALLGYTGSFA